MMSLLQWLGAAAMALACVGCSSATDGVPIPESITVDPNNPKRIRFVVHGDPGLSRYPEINNLPLPMPEKIREGMRRYAADELRARNLCLNGFKGPDVVLAKASARLTSRFWVDCL
jgi:hypothetical protein